MDAFIRVYLQKKHKILSFEISIVPCDVRYTSLLIKFIDFYR